MIPGSTFVRQISHDFCWGRRQMPALSLSFPNLREYFGGRVGGRMFKQLQSHSGPRLRKRNSVIQCHRVAIEHLPVTDVRCLHESTILSSRAIGKSNFDLAARVSRSGDDVLTVDAERGRPLKLLSS